MATCVRGDVAQVPTHARRLNAPERAVVHDRVELVGQPQSVRRAEAVAELGPLGVESKEEGAGGGAGGGCLLHARG